MTEKWTKARCERELKDPKNWETYFSNNFIQEKQFEFYTVTFVRYEILTAVVDWKHRNDISNSPVIGVWNDSRKLYVRTYTGGKQYALSEVSRPEAVDLMMDALKKEGIL